MTRIKKSTYNLIIVKYKKENGYMYAITKKNKTTLSLMNLRTMDELLKELKEVLER